MKNLKIYFTSDMHGYIYPTNYVDRSEKNIGLLNIMSNFQKDENTLIIDCGDTIQGSPFTNYLSKDEFTVHPIGDIMNAAGYDYITLGNHDFNYGLTYLNKYLHTLKAKCLCANIVDKTGQLPIFPYDIKTLGNGLKVGIIGITTDFINKWERAENIEHLIISDTYKAISYYFNEVKSACDVIVGIYHGGFEYDLETHKQLTKTSENIAYKLCEDFAFDILLTGHQHMSIPGQKLHGTHIGQTPFNGSKYLELNLNLNNDGSKEIQSDLKDISLNPNKEMYNKYLPLENKIQQWLDTPVGFLNKELIPSSHLEMALNGSNLANFINQIQLAESNADISCTSFSNEIKGFNKNVTVRDIMSTYKYPNTLAVLEVNRKYLKLALERSASYFHLENNMVSISNAFLKPKVQHYNYDYFANLEYTFDLTKPVNERVTSIKYKGKELDDNTSLSLVMNNYRATGAGGYEFLEECKVIKEILCEMPEVIINYFTLHKNVEIDCSTYIKVIY